MKLYYSPTSPYVRKVSAVAVELGIELETETVAVHAFPSDYGRVNPVNRVPAMRLAEIRRPPEQQNPGRLAEYVRSVTQTLDALEADAAGLDGVNLGTLTIGCALGYLDFRYPDEPWRTGRPALAAWYDGFARRPSMLQTVPKAP